MAGHQKPVEPQGPTAGTPCAPQPVCPPGLVVPPPEPESGFPTQFARLFFGVVTVLVLYYSYAIIKPYLIDLFLALVIFFTAKPLYKVINRVLFGQRTLASALTCLILALIIILPLVTLVSIVAKQALELSSQLGQGLQSGTLGQWLNHQMDSLQAFLTRLNLPLPPEQIKLEGMVRTVLANASKFIYTNAVGVLTGFTNLILDLALILFVAFFLFLQGDDFIAEVKSLSPLSAGG